MKRIILAAGIMAVCPAIAGEYHTVTWFVDHPDAMHWTLRQCRDNAGLAARNPNCVNADEAGTIIVQRELEAAGGGAGDPRSPSYWRERPGDRRQQLFTCDAITKQHVTPDPTTAAMCVAARAGG